MPRRGVGSCGTAAGAVVAAETSSPWAPGIHLNSLMASSLAPRSSYRQSKPDHCFVFSRRWPYIVPDTSVSGTKCDHHSDHPSAAPLQHGRGTTSDHCIPHRQKSSTGATSETHSLTLLPWQDKCILKAVCCTVTYARGVGFWSF